MDPICRVSNPSIKLVCEINHILPLECMPEGRMIKIVNDRWNRAEWKPGYKKFKDFFESSYQPYAQMGLYYKDGTNYYPRLKRFISYEEAEDYLMEWFKKYYSPNPYSKANDDEMKPIVMHNFITNYIIENGEASDWNQCLKEMFGEDIGNTDIINNVINWFSDFIIDEKGIISFKTGKETSIKYNDDEIYLDCDPNDRKLFFERFGGKITPRNESENDQLPYITAIRTKPFLLLAGISGTGKSRIVRKLAQATDDIDVFANDSERFSCHSPANFCLIQVKPNWHNSMDVVGFKSNIGKDGEHYEYTPFIEFVGKAWQNLNTPFFLCLDEMNLAPVEEYFAEFLSAIESRSIDASGTYETDPIIKPFKNFGQKVAFDMIEHLIGEKVEDVDKMSDLAKRLYDKGLTLPQNLIVMGTVNMDETTFSFSRKVLDRAMSIEMNEVNYDAFLEGTTEDDIPVLTDINDLLVNRPIKALEVKNDIDGDKITEYLKAINTILDGTPFKLGYRAANEAMLYVAAAKNFGKDNIADALDDFTLMKILSRIEGDSSKLKTAGGECILETLSNFFNSAEGILSELKNSKTIAKLGAMKLILERDHFVSFWN